MSLARWANCEVASKTDASSVLDKLRAAVRAGTFDECGMDFHPEPSPLTFRAFADVYKTRHVVTKGLAFCEKASRIEISEWYAGCTKARSYICSSRPLRSARR